MEEEEEAEERVEKGETDRESEIAKSWSVRDWFVYDNRPYRRSSLNVLGGCDGPVVGLSSLIHVLRFHGANTFHYKGL